MATFGYAGKILRVDLSSGITSWVSTMDYADRFLGGRGIAAKFYWDEVSPDTGTFDAQNRLIFATGPLCGLPALGSSRWVVCGKSPATVPEQFSYGNLGGTWGAELKFAGYDAIVVQGKAERPVYLFIHDDTVELRDAAALWGKGSIETRETLKNELGSLAKVVAIGPAGENMVTIATLLADNDASGSGGLGAVMGSKKMKAIVVRGTGKRAEIAHPERLRELTRHYCGLKRIPLRMSPQRYSPDPMFDMRKVPGSKNMKMDRCYGCFTGCARMIYQAQDGKKGKFMCSSAIFYQPRSEKYYGEWNDVPFHVVKLCDDYGIDTYPVDLIVSWLEVCYKAGIFTDENTGIPISRLGSLEFMEALIRKMSLREGFGDILAQGLVKAGDLMGPVAKEQLKFAGYVENPGSDDAYAPRLYITTALLYAMEPRMPIQQLHEATWSVAKWVAWVKKAKGGVLSTDAVRAIARRFWGSEMAVDFSTYEGKALAAKMVQDREYVKECLVLCDFMWPVIELEDSQDRVGDPSLESKILSAVTGNELDEDGLYRVGERVFNLQRAILVREGHRGRKFDSLPDSWQDVPLQGEYLNPECIVPGKGEQIISRKGAVVDREELEKVKSEYYRLRRWDEATGLQSRAKLEELGLGDVVPELEQRGLIGPRYPKSEPENEALKN